MKGNTTMKKCKILSMIAAITIIAASTMSVNAQSTEPAQKSTTDNYLTQEEVFEALAHTFSDTSLKKEIESENKYSPTGALMQSFDAESYSEYTNNEYGGMYLNDEGTLIICYVDGSNTLKAAKSKLSTRKVSAALTNEDNEIVAEKYSFKPVKYSEKELLDAYDLINNLAVKNGIIKSAGIDVFENRVIVGISEISDIEQVEKDLVSIDGMYAFELQKKSDYQFCATINGTAPINNGSIQSTPAGKIFNDMFDGWGIVTCGHGWATNNNVYYGNTKIGTVRKRIFNSTNDSSLIQLSSGHSYSDIKHDEFDSSVPVVGSSMTLRGFVSGRISGAKVLLVNGSETIQGTYCSDMIKCDKPVKSGDSGGGAIGRYIDGGRTAVILGINRASNGVYTYLVKGKVICAAF